MAGSNETDAAVASLCAREVAAQAESLGVEPAVRLNEFPRWTRKLALGVFLVSITYYAITLVWWFARRKHYLIRKRGSLFMLLTTFGLIYSEIAVLLRVYMGISTFLCDLYNWRLVAISLIVGPIVTRLILHANGSRFNTMLLERGKRDVAFEEYRDLTVANASRVFLYTCCGMCLRGRRRRPHTRRAQLERRESIGSQAIDSETEDELEDQHRAQSRHEANDGRAQSPAHLKHSHHHRATVGIEEGGSREGNGQVPSLSQREATSRAAGKSRTLRSLTFDEQQLLVAYYKTTNMYGLMLAGGFALAPVAYTVSTMLREHSPYGGKGCQGCLGSALDVLVVAVTFGVMLVIGCSVITQTQSGDALGVVAELRKCMGLSVLTAVATAIVMADPGELQRRRIFPLDMIVVPFLMMIHFVQCPLQVYRTKCPILNWLANCKVQAPKNGGQGAPSESIHHRTFGSGKSSRGFVAHSSSFSRSMRAPPPSPSTISPSRNALESSDEVSFSRTISCTMTSSTRLALKPSLEEVLESAEGRQAFVRQLSREHSIESYYLVDAVQRYRVMQEQHPSSPLVLDMVFKIYRTFIADNSILQVNVSWNVSRELARAVAALSESEAQVQEPAGDLFDGVLSEVIEVMRRDSFQRFLLSDLSQDYLRRRRTRLCHAATA